MEETTSADKEYGKAKRSHLFITGEARLAMWRKLRGMWKDRQPNPIEELEKIRAEWDRDIPPVR
jgi:hypothetical protein